MILVTGATGFLGVHLLMELSEKEQTPIKALYRTESKKEEALQVFLKYNPYADAAKKWHQIIWEKADITDLPSLETVFKKITQIYHCAAYVTFDSSKFNLLKKVNIEGTANLVNLALSNNITSFCYVSSIATLNLNPGEKLYTEKSQWNPEANNSDYAISKFGGEMEVWRGIQEGLNAVIVNPGVIFGSGFFNTGSGEIFKKVANGIPFYTPGGTGYVSVTDCVQIMRQLMIQGHFNERFILVCKNNTHKSVINTIAEHLNVQSPKKEITKKWLTLISKFEYILNCISNYQPNIPLDIINSLYSISEYNNNKIVSLLNWNFEELETILQKTALDYQSSLSTPSPLSESVSS